MTSVEDWGESIDYIYGNKERGIKTAAGAALHYSQFVGEGMKDETRKALEELTESDSPEARSIAKRSLEEQEQYD